MSFIVFPEIFAAGDFVAPFEVNSARRIMWGEFNGRLDADNLPANVIERDRFQIGALNRIATDSADAALVYTRPASGSRFHWVDVPAASLSVGLQVSITTGDGQLEVIGSVASQFSAEGRLLVGVFLDGILQAQSGSNGTTLGDSRWLRCTFPVGAGSHVVKLRFQAPSELAGNVTFNGAPFGRQMLVREARR